MLYNFYFEDLLKLEGKRSSYGYAAYSISQLNEPLSTLYDLYISARDLPVSITFPYTS